MAETEPERLLLWLHELQERRGRLRAVFEQALRRVLTDQERDDLEQVLASIDGEIASVRERLEALREAGGDGKA